MKALKIILIALAVLLLLIVLAVGGIASAVYFGWVEPNDAKPEITRVVQEQTGRDLTIKGDIELSVFPWLGVILNDVKFSNAKGFGPEPFAQMERAEVRVKILPLLEKQIEVDIIRMKRGIVRLERNAQGQTNWDDLTRGETTQPTPEPTTDSEFDIASLNLGGLEIIDAQLYWKDASTKNDYRLSDLDLEMGAIALKRGGDTSFPIKLGASLNMNEPPMDVRLTLNSQLTADIEKLLFSAQNFTANVAAKGKALPNGAINAKLHANLSADLDKGTAELSKLELNALGLDISGTTTITQLLTTPQLAGRLRIAPFNLKKLLTDLKIEIPEPRDPKAMESATLNANFNANDKKARLNNLAIKMDDSTLSGWLEISDYATPDINFDLALDEIDADRYQPPAEDKPAPTTNKTASTPAERKAAREQLDATAIPTDWAKDLRLNGQIKLGKFTASGLKLQDTVLKAKARGGLITVDTLRTNLYNGKLWIKGNLDARTNLPKIQLETKMTGVQAGQLQQDLLQKVHVSGQTDLSGNLTTAGNTIGALRRALSGTLVLAFRDGAVEGFNIGHVIRVAKARIKGEPVPPDSANQKTDFASLSGSFQINNGIATNTDLDGKSPLLRLGGNGTINLVDETMDYTARPVIVETSSGQDGKGLQELRGVPIPIRCRGEFAAPNCKPKLDDALKEAAKAKAKEKAKEKIQEKYGDKIDKFKDKLDEKAPGLLDKLPFDLFKR